MEGDSGREELCDEILLTFCEVGLSEGFDARRLLGVDSVAFLMVGEDLAGVFRLMSRRGGRDDSRK